MRLSEARGLWECWLAAAGTWQGWSVCPLLLSPNLETVEPRPPSAWKLRMAAELTEKIQSDLTGTGTCLLVDLDPAIGISIAGVLCARGVAQPLVLLPRWPYASAILDSAEPLWTLREAAPVGVAPIPSGNVCIVIDAQRQTGPTRQRTESTRVDNRYQLMPHDFPSLSDLRARDIRRIVRLSPL